MSQVRSLTIEEYKTCTKCGQTKPRTSEFFYKSKRSPDGLRPDCSECGRQRSSKYASENKQKTRDSSNAWRVNNAERKKANNSNWYQKNRVAIRAKWKEDYKADPERFKISGRVRRARVKQVPFERYRVEDVLAQWGTNCHICGLSIDLTAPRQMRVSGWEKGLHLDHVIPISKGGPDTLANVKPAHGLCNIRKNAG
jgi:5-methylcytosine-specific restriction endonuclease McrA